uniref:F-box domain-containing protein n=2 Tax=Oryza glaberrima TaxID=4538 RepID=I1PL35_ORYGL
KAPGREEEKMVATTTIEDLHADVLARALRRLDGRSLAAASCATAGLRALAADPETWRTLCLAEWPSMAGHPRLLSVVPPRRLFADAFPFPRPDAGELGGGGGGPLPSELVSAVDVYYRGAPLLSRVVETPASSPWFLGSPFRVEAVECKKPAAEAALSPAELELSWVVVDPARGRAVNVSSRRAVAVDRHWYTGETLVRFAVVLGGCKFEATVTCSEGAGNISEVSLAVQDADGAAASGERSLRLLAAAMEEQRIGGGRERDEAKRRYDEFVKSRKGRKESKARREALIDLCCSAASAMAVLSFVAAVVLR